MLAVLGTSDLMCTILLKYVVIHWRLTNRSLQKHSVTTTLTMTALKALVTAIASTTNRTTTIAYSIMKPNIEVLVAIQED